MAPAPVLGSRPKYRETKMSDSIQSSLLTGFKVRGSPTLLLASFPSCDGQYPQTVSQNKSFRS